MPRPAHSRPPPHRGRKQSPRSPAERRPDSIWIYGIHPVQAALANPQRTVRRLVATPNAIRRLAESGVGLVPAPEEVTPRDIDRLLGADTVHQGVAAEVEPLAARPVEDLADARFVVVLDQVTDPHNVGAILRSAAAFGADAVVTTGRHSPVETGVLAKSASGALDVITRIEVPNLARALEALGEMGFVRIGLDGAADAAMEDVVSGDKLVLVLGAEGKGLRHLTRETCDVLARLSVAGALASLNVSNAAVLALYLARRHLDGHGKAATLSPPARAATASDQPV